MKTLIFIIAVIFAFVISVSAQTTCPIISVTGPSSITQIGDNWVFTAKVEGIDLNKIQYEWAVENGKILSGQGTPIINVPFTEEMSGITITATVKIIGLPEGCANEASASGEQIICPPHIVDSRIDIYGKISWREEKIRLQDLTPQLKAYDKSTLYLIIKTNEKKYLQFLKVKENKIRNYLFNNYQIAKDRIRVVYGGNGKYQTDVWLVPAGAAPPF